MQGYITKKGIIDEIKIHSHGNTKFCNPNMLEINPAIGCQFECQYCNAYTQEKDNCFNGVVVYEDYPEYLRSWLNDNKNVLDKIFFYYSPKIDCFQDCLIETGVTEKILALFKEYNVKYFMITKGGVPNDAIKKLLINSKDLNQIIISCTMPNEDIRRILEPNAKSISERMELARFCVDNGIRATGIFSPILPIDNLQFVKDYIKNYIEMGIYHFRVDYTEISRESLRKLCDLLPEYKEQLEAVYLDKDATITHWKVPYTERQIERYWPSMEYMCNTFNDLKNYAESIDERATVSVCNSLCTQDKLYRFNDKCVNHGINCIGYIMNVEKYNKAMGK